LRDPDYFKVWTAETASAFGTKITTLALPILAATTLGASPLEFGLLAAVAYAPHVLVSLPAGVWVDQVRRRPVLIAADLGRALSLISLPVAFLLGGLSMAHLYVGAPFRSARLLAPCLPMSLGSSRRSGSGQSED
jgi:MFS family permease